MAGLSAEHVLELRIGKLKEKLDNPDWKERLSAVEEIKQIGKKAILATAENQLVSMLLRDADTEVRMSCIEALAMLGDEVEPFVEEIVEKLGDKTIDPLSKNSGRNMRKAALEALRILGPPALPHVDKIAELLEDSASIVRVAAANTLEVMAQLSLEAIQPREREALGEEGEEQQPGFSIVDALGKNLRDWEEYTRKGACRIMAMISSETTIPYDECCLTMMKEDPSPLAREEVPALIVTIGLAAFQKGPSVLDEETIEEQKLKPTEVAQENARREAKWRNEARLRVEAIMMAVFDDEAREVRQAAGMQVVLGRLVFEELTIWEELEKACQWEEPVAIPPEVLEAASESRAAWDELSAGASVELPPELPSRPQTSAVPGAPAEPAATDGEVPRAATAPAGPGEPAPPLPPAPPQPPAPPALHAALAAGGGGAPEDVAGEAKDEAQEEAEEPQRVTFAEDGSPEKRIAALDFIALWGASSVKFSEHVSRALADPDMSVRMAACETIRIMGKETAVPFAERLVDLLLQAGEEGQEPPAAPGGPEEPTPPDEAPSAPEAPEETPVDDDDDGAAGAPEVAGQDDDLIEDPEMEMQLAALDTLMCTGEVAHGFIERLAEAVKDKRISVKWGAMKGLAAMKELSAPHAHIVARLLLHPSFLLRRAAAETLGEMGPAAAPYTESLLTSALTDADWDVRVACCKAFAKQGEAAGAHVGKVALAMEDEKKAVKIAAAYCLGAMGEAASPHLFCLMPMLSMGDPKVRLAAVEASGNLGKVALSYFGLEQKIEECAFRDVDEIVQAAAKEAHAKISIHKER